MARGFRAIVMVLATVLLLVPAARAQEDNRSPEQLLADFIHYTKTDRNDLAAAAGQQLLDLGLTPSAFVDLIDNSGEQARFLETVPQAMRNAGRQNLPTLGAVAAGLDLAYRDGRLARARSPEEIARNIELLKGLAQARRLGRERLVAAGEYALPQLLEAFLQSNDRTLRGEVRRVLIDLGRQSIIPLATALPGLDETNQDLVVDVLGQIPYRTSLPFLTDLFQQTPSEQVRESCRRAIERLGGDPAFGATLMYVDLGEAYYSERAELTSFEGEEYQLLWAFDPGVGLVMTPIRTEVFHDAMAMRMAERSLELRSQNPEGIALWVAANLKREIETPEGYDNPAYPSDRRDAMYFAVASGVDIEQRVLARALDTRNTPLARRAIAAIEQTAGGSALWSGPVNRRPLLEALDYPNRRVQFESALALGIAQPLSAFTGSERVVPILASAIRDSSKRYAVIVSENAETAVDIRRALEGSGYTVLPPGRRLDDLELPISETPGIDLIVSDVSAAATEQLIGDVRNSIKLAATPVLAILEPLAYEELSRKYGRDSLIAARPRGISAAQMVTSVDDLVMRASGGPIGESEAQAYAVRSLDVLRDLAVSGNPVLNVADATLPLIGSLGPADAPTRLKIAEVLSRIGEQRAQVALMDAAMAASAGERVDLLGKVADSAKRFGNMLAGRQTDRLLKLAQSTDSAEATAAAALIGALGLPNQDLVPLILQN